MLARTLSIARNPLFGAWSLAASVPPMLGWMYVVHLVGLTPQTAEVTFAPSPQASRGERVPS